MNDYSGVKIAVDFDGTIVDHEYPAIGKEKLFAFQTLKELEKKGALIILWTFRTGRELQEAVEFCRSRGLEFYAVNKNYPEEVYNEATTSRKINADIYIDDKNIGGFPGWSNIWQLLNPYELHEREVRRKLESSGNRFLRLFKKKSGNEG